MSYAWTDPAREHLDTAYAIFQDLVSLAEQFVAERQYAAAAMVAQIAAEYASHNHPGLFASDRLEAVLHAVGSRAVRSHPRSTRPRFGDAPAHVLCVMTKAVSIGGTTRQMWRWMREDGARRYTVALTRQSRAPIPEPFRRAVADAGGTLHVLNARTSDPIARAQALRDLSATADQVLLIPIPYDVVPIIAFANRHESPPAALVDHCDHMFWVGARTSDLVVHGREAGRMLGQARRGLASERQALVPIPLTPPTRTLNRAEAKACIGCPDEAVLILTIATAYKYIPIKPPGFLDLMLPVLERHEQARLVAVGPDPTGAWAEAEARTQGRVKALGRRTDTAAFYQAADVYVDSSPFASNTSLLEAGGYGVPLLTYERHSREAHVLNAGSPGLDRDMIRARDPEAYRTALSRLITDRDLREHLGEATRITIMTTHSGERWLRALEDTYRQASALAPATAPSCATDDAPRESELDVALSRRGGGFGLQGIIEDHTRSLPWALRLRLLCRLRRVERAFSRTMFLPEALGARVSAWASRVRPAGRPASPDEE